MVSDSAASPASSDVSAEVSARSFVSARHTGGETEGGGGPRVMGEAVGGPGGGRVFKTSCAEI